jgi:hypothetical protein
VATRRWYLPTIDRHPAFRQIAHLPTPVAYDIQDRLLGCRSTSASTQSIGGS